MKRHVIPVLAAFALFCLVGCSKELSFETNGNPVIPVDTSDFHATVNGVAWKATDTGRSAVIYGGTITITGISSDNKVIALELSGSTAATYTLDSNSLSVGVFTDNNSSNTFPYSTNQNGNPDLAGGTVTVTSIDPNKKIISGTFQMNAYRLLDNSIVQVTAGVFTNIPYTTTQPPVSQLDTFKVTIDGTPLTAATINGYIAGGQILIQGASADGMTSVGFVMPQSIAEGSYNLDLSGSTLGLYTSTTTVMESASGTLVILENNPATKRIRGNFDFHAVDPVGSGSAEITAGYFSLIY